ncbi:MAG: hypothetical protein COV74_04865 [Candidatus Omnitrophica bacterium CG11_big_fil_rev_8_21_14_0_20_45_26]|uniref:Uncharacterized protein n=1 Tax=Candidatus Abzuiibacterium crystallinum TaxID=1974748 RepID=A0A2H0LPM9_9BACT|nr:MAG: hypothetical protein COV74_04865 [Candidatus Omnitrophica bacterium CG11_big_fil_rev_8_21_14_0_20_45_26]PIW63592.1 MAG: hypothetical protein COW12_09780 [Candidatus Omnitrophica bacterium CG12_big_fil_rev_8_21_14_0_65_45_16]
MDDIFKSNEMASASPQNDSEDTTNSRLKKIQERLTALEQKIDTLLKQSSQKPAFQRDRFSKPERRFGRFDKHRKRSGHFHSRDDGPSSSRPFDKPRHFDKSRQFDKPAGDDRRRDDRSGPDFGGKKKPFFHRGKRPR